MIQRLIQRLIRFKIYFDRSRVYVGYGQFFIILLVFFEAYKETKFGVWFYSKWWTLPAFVVLFFVVSIIIGYIDKVFIRPREVTELNKINPEFMKMYKKIMEQ